MNYPTAFYHVGQLPRINCIKYRHCRRQTMWPYGLGLRLLGHATLSIPERGVELQVIHLENKFGKRLVVVPPKDLAVWRRLESTWHGDTSMFLMARVAIDAYLVGTFTPQPERVRSVA